MILVKVEVSILNVIDTPRLNGGLKRRGPSVCRPTSETSRLRARVRALDLFAHFVHVVKQLYSLKLARLSRLPPICKV